MQIAYRIFVTLSKFDRTMSLTFIFVIIGAVVFFHEPVSVQKTVGLAVILLGILLIARG